MKHVLIVEDSGQLAFVMETMLKAAGYTVCGKAASVEDARTLLDSRPCDAALLDIALGEQSALPLVEVLAQRDIPFLVISGTSAERLPREFAGAPYLAKPFTAPQLEAAIAALGDEPPTAA